MPYQEMRTPRDSQLQVYQSFELYTRLNLTTRRQVLALIVELGRASE
jgi:hypothetical protein